MKNSPLGIKLICAYFILRGPFQAISTFFASFLYFRYLISSVELKNYPFLFFMGFAIAIAVVLIFLAIGILSFCIGINLLKLKEWARRLGFYLTIFYFILTILKVLSAVMHISFYRFIYYLILIGIDLFIIYYLCDPILVAQFNPESPMTEQEDTTKEKENSTSVPGDQKEPEDRSSSQSV